MLIGDLNQLLFIQLLCFLYVNNNPFKFVDPDGNAAVTLGFDVQGSFAGMGLGASAKVAVSLSRGNDGGWKFQVGGTAGVQTGAAGVALEQSQDMTIGEKIGAVVTMLSDTGISAAAEVGAFVGTSENPADVDDLGGTTVEIGGSIGKKSLGKVANALPGSSVSGELKFGENGVNGTELGVGVGAGATVDVDSSAKPVIFYEAEF